MIFIPKKKLRLLEKTMQAALQESMGGMTIVGGISALMSISVYLAKTTENSTGCICKASGRYVFFCENRGQIVDTEKYVYSE